MQKYQDYYGQPNRAIKTWQAALYIRLSKEDMDKNKTESASIANQREILKEYLKLHPDIAHVDTYVDDGYSGTDFDRPGWTRLMQDIRLKRINCVIVKDLARLGRNYTISPTQKNQLRHRQGFGASRQKLHDQRRFDR